MRKVYCYFEALVDGPPFQGQLIRLWHRSWTQHGWDVRMLSPRTLWRSRLIKAADLKGPASETIRLRRVLSLCRVGGGLLVDYDVINFGLTPRKFSEGIKGRGGLVSSGLIYYTPDDARMIRTSYSAMTMCHPVLSRLAIPVEYPEPGWRTAPLVHFTGSCDPRPKYEIIETCGRPI